MGLDEEFPQRKTGKIVHLHKLTNRADVDILLSEPINENGLAGVTYGEKNYDL